MNYINNSLHLVRKYALMFVCQCYLFQEATDFLRPEDSESCDLFPQFTERTLWKSKRLTTGGYSWEGNMTAMFPSPLYFKLLHTTFLALCTTQIQMFMVTFLTFAFPLFPLCFRLQLGTEQAVVSNNFTILSRLACTWGISGTLYEMRNSWCKGSGTSYDFSWPNPAQVLC